MYPINAKTDELAAAKLAGGQFTFTPGYTLPNLGKKLIVKSGSSVKSAAAACAADEKCVGFTTSGILVTKIPNRKWLKKTKYASEGFFEKAADACDA